MKSCKICPEYNYALSCRSRAHVYTSTSATACLPLIMTRKKTGIPVQCPWCNLGMKSSSLIKHISCSCPTIQEYPFTPQISEAFAGAVDFDRVCGCGAVFPDESKWVHHFFHCAYGGEGPLFIDPDEPECRRFDEIAHQIVASQEQQPEDKQLVENANENSSEPSSSAKKASKNKNTGFNVRCPWCDTEHKSGNLVKHLNNTCTVSTAAHQPRITTFFAMLFDVFKVCGCGRISRNDTEWKKHKTVCASAGKRPLLLRQSTPEGFRFDLIALRQFALTQQQSVCEGILLVNEPISLEHLEGCVQYKEKHLFRLLDWYPDDFPWHLEKLDSEEYADNNALAGRVMRIMLKAIAMSHPHEDPDVIKRYMSIKYD